MSCADSLPESERVIRDVTCTQCGCVCDDLEVTLRDNQILQIQPSCPLAETFFDRLKGNSSVTPEIRGVSRSHESAIGEAAAILRASRSPLIYGLSRSATAAQRAACRLADTIGANIDTTASTCHAPSILALQQAGESTSTLGEVGQRSDLVIYWGSNPVQSHPRHIERFSGGLDRKGGRFLVVIDTTETETSAIADLFIKIEPNRDFEFIHTVRALLKGASVASGCEHGVPTRVLDQFVSRIRTCRYGAVFFGLGITHGPLPHLTVDGLLRLVTELNQETRFVARRMRIPGDVTGADSVLCWQTGYPFSVNLNRDYPRYNPGEFTANDLLERQEVDCALMVGAEGVRKLSAASRNYLQSIPTVVLEYPTEPLPFTPSVLFRTAIYGVHKRGSVYRMDEVPVPLRPVMESELPSDDAVLLQILQELRPRSPSEG